MASCWWAASCGTWPLQLGWWWIATACALALAGKHSGNDWKFRNALSLFFFFFFKVSRTRRLRRKKKTAAAAKNIFKVAVCHAATLTAKVSYYHLWSYQRFFRLPAAPASTSHRLTIVVHIWCTASVIAHNRCRCLGCDKHPLSYDFKNPALKSAANACEKHRSTELIIDQNKITIVPRVQDLFSLLVIKFVFKVRDISNAVSTGWNAGDTSKDALSAWDQHDRSACRWAEAEAVHLNNIWRQRDKSGADTQLIIPHTSRVLVNFMPHHSNLCYRCMNRASWEYRGGRREQSHFVGFPPAVTRPSPHRSEAGSCLYLNTMYSKVSNVFAFDDYKAIFA